MATKNTTITVSVAETQNYLPASKTIDVSVTVPGTSLADIVTSSKLINDTNPIIIYDENSLWKGEPIEWLAIGIDQDGNNTVTLQTYKVLTGFAWDTKNTSGDSSRQNYGANRVDSLLHQWLNSDQTDWYSSQHNNQAPSDSTVRHYTTYGMDSAVAKGFMTNLSNDFKNKIVTVTKNVTPYRSGEPSSFTGKLFCLSMEETDPSPTESSYIPEEGAFTYQRFQAKGRANRIKSAISPAPANWWLRSPGTNNSVSIWFFNSQSVYSRGGPIDTDVGAAPACVLPSNTIVEEDENGKYKIIW